MTIKAVMIHIGSYEYYAMQHADEATATILEDIAKDIRTFGLRSDALPCILRDADGNKVGTLDVEEE